jgi:Enolase C-terminal domain-like
VDFVQPSPAKMGGITELRKVYTAAAIRNVTVMLHSFYDGPGLLAAIHATAALGTADSMIEWRFFDLEANVLGEALTVKDGRVLVPQVPGSESIPTRGGQRLSAERLGRTVIPPRAAPRREPPASSHNRAGGTCRAAAAGACPGCPRRTAGTPSHRA